MGYRVYFAFAVRSERDICNCNGNNGTFPLHWRRHPWWRHQMEPFSALLAICVEFTGPGEFPTQRPVTRSFDVLFDLRLNKRLSHCYKSTLAQAMFFFIWHQVSTRTILDFPLVRFSSIHVGAISQQVFRIQFCTMSLKIRLLKVLPHIPGSSELKDNGSSITAAQWTSGGQLSDHVLRVVSTCIDLASVETRACTLGSSYQYWSLTYRQQNV